MPATIDGWRARNGCDASSSAYFAEGNGSCTRHDGCAEHGEVVLCAIEGGGHSWPGGAPKAALVECPANGAQSATFLASEAIWRFFAAHARPR